MNHSLSGLHASPSGWHRWWLACTGRKPALPLEVQRRQIALCQGKVTVALLVNLLVAAAAAWATLTPANRASQVLWLISAGLLATFIHIDCLLHRSLPLDWTALARARWSLRRAGALQGLLWTLAGTLMLPASSVHQRILAAAVCLAVAGAAVVLSPLPSAFVLFAIPATLPLALGLLAGNLPGQALTGSLVLIYTGAMAALAIRIGGQLRDALVAAQASEALTLDLRRAITALSEYHAQAEQVLVQRSRELDEISSRLAADTSSAQPAETAPLEGGNGAGERRAH